MKNKIIAKSLLALAALGVTVTTLAGSIEASESYGPRDKKPVSINNNIVEYNDGTFGYGARPATTKSEKKNDLLLKREQQLQNAEQLVREFEKTHTINAHRKAQRAVNIVSFEYSVKKHVLQERIENVLKNGYVK